MSTDRRMDKEYVVHIHNGMLFSHKETDLILVKWMNLKPVVPNEVSQREKKNYYILTHIWNLEKWHWWTYLQGRNGDTDIENGLVGPVGEGESEMNGESSINTYSVQFSSVAQSCLTLCNPMNNSTPGIPVHHQLPESTQTHVLWVDDAIQPSHPLSSPSSPALNLSQRQGLFKWVSSSHQVAKVLEF